MLANSAGFIIRIYYQVEVGLWGEARGAGGRDGRDWVSFRYSLTMSFLDNLENNLKALEAREEFDAAAHERQRAARAAERRNAELTAPHADALRNGPFTAELLTACRVIGHPLRLLVRPTWIGDTLRLEAREKRVDLVPTPEGVQAQFFLNSEAQAERMVDLGGDPTAFAKSWLAG